MTLATWLRPKGIQEDFTVPNGLSRIPGRPAERGSERSLVATVLPIADDGHGGALVAPAQHELSGVPGEKGQRSLR